MDTMRIPCLIVLIISIQHTPASTAMEPRKVLAIPEKIIGGVIDIVQSHKNKPSQQSSFQQTVQTQQTFAQAGYPQNQPTAPYQPWNGQNQNYQNQGISGQAQIQAQGQFGVNQGNYPTNTNYPTNQNYPPQNNYPVNGQYYPVNGQTPVQGQYQNNYNNQQSSGQYQNQNQNQQGFGSNQFQGQNQGSYQQTGQYGSGNGNYQGSQGAQYGQGGNFQGQNVQTGQYGQGASQNGQYNNQQQNGQFSSSSQSGQSSQSGHYQTSQGQTSGQSGSFTTQGSSGGSQGSTSHHTGPNGTSCVCQTWTKPPEALADTPRKTDNATEQKMDPKMLYQYY